MPDPYFPFYVADWRNDPRLRDCSFAARGLWVEMMCLMHEAPDRGYLIVGSRSYTESDVERIAHHTGGKPALVRRLLAELKDAGVYSLRDDGVIFSRRMVRDTEKQARDKQNGRLGGNPKLVIPRVNPPDKAHAGAPIGAGSGSGVAELEATDRSKMSEAMEFGKWFFSTAFSRGALPDGWRIAPGVLGLALQHREVCETLLAGYGLEACQLRAERMFARSIRTDEQRLLKSPTPQTLHEIWHWFETDQVGRKTARATKAPHDVRDIGGAEAAAAINAKILRIG